MVARALRAGWDGCPCSKSDALALLGLSKELLAGAAREEVARLCAQFGLEKVENMLLDRLSGGERRRVVTVAELICRPDILFLDEPLSGLDSFNVDEYLRFLKHCDCRTVVFVGHQLKDSVLQQFDDILVLSSAGQNVIACPTQMLKDHVAQKNDYDRFHLLEAAVIQSSQLCAPVPPLYLHPFETAASPLRRLRWLRRCALQRGGTLSGSVCCSCCSRLSRSTRTGARSRTRWCWRT